MKTLLCFALLVSGAPFARALTPADIWLSATAPGGQFLPGSGTLTVAENEWIYFRADVALPGIGDPGEPLFQWLKNGQPIPDAAERSIEIYPTTLADAGTYSVRVTVGSESATQGAVTVVVVNGLALRAEPANPVRRGGAVTFTASAPGAGTISSVRWFFKGSLLPPNPGLTLTLSSVDFEQAGDYHVSAFFPNLNRTVNSPTVPLKIYALLASPVIVSPPADQVGRTGGGAVFSVGASGTPPFRYQWQKDGANIPNATNFYLALNNLQSTAAANYRAVVSNVSGSSTSSVARLTLAAPPAPNSLADSLVTSGRGGLAQQTNTSLSAAAVTFATAAGAAPEHEFANFFTALTRVLDVINQTAANQLLDRLQVSKTGRNLYDWHAKGPERAPADVNAQELPAFARDHLLPQIQGALTNLARLRDAGFTLDLTGAETTGPDVTVDQGDLFVLRAGLSFYEYFIRTFNSWNVSIQLQTLEDFSKKSFNLQTLLERYPDLLTFSDATQLAPARAALERAIDSYLQGAALIHNRPPGLRRLFNLDLQEDGPDEDRFRQFLLDLKASLSQSMTLNEEPQFQIAASALFDPAQSPRSLLPRAAGRRFDLGTLPDPKLAGALRAFGSPEILGNPMDHALVPGTRVSFGVLALGEEPLEYQWQKDGQNIAKATNAILTLASVQASDAGAYAVRVQNGRGQVLSSPARLWPGGLVLDTTPYEDTEWEQFYRPMPSGLSEVVMISAGGRNLALKNDGTVVEWGWDNGQGPPPAFLLNNVISISAGSSHNLALNRNGTVIAWGNNSDGQTMVPWYLSNVVAIAAGGNHSLALRSDGTVFGWGNPGPARPPSDLDDVIAIAAGQSHSLALHADGTVTTWGNSFGGEMQPPSGLNGVIAIAAGAEHSLALRSDGSVIGWGPSVRSNGSENSAAQAPPGLSNVKLIRAAWNTSMALKNDGTVVVWGETYGFPPRVACSMDIALGLALGPVLLWDGPDDTRANEGDTIRFNVSVRSALPVSYQWYFNGQPVQGATNLSFALSHLQTSSAGNYSLAAFNGSYRIHTRAAKLIVNSQYDSFANARALPGGGGRVLGSNLNATRELGEPNHAGSPASKSLWYRWQAPVSGPVVIDTVGSSFDTVLAVYSGSALASLTLIAADDDGAGINYNSRVNFNASAGASYWIVVDGFDGDSGGVILNLTPSLKLGNLALSATEGFALTASGENQQLFVIEYSLDLENWVPLSTNVFPQSGLLEFLDRQAVTEPKRFYRAVAE